jgi:sigma-B regulation protein RsbU (phosphoserine phosphatase)
VAFASPQPAEVLTRANGILLAQQTDFGSFSTVFLAVLDLETGCVIYSSAGHPPPIVCCEDGTVEMLSEGQPPLGLLENIQYQQYNLSLQPAEKIIFYTDGISEARSGGELLDLEGVRDIVSSHAKEHADQILEALLREATQWARGRLSDDAAIVVLERSADQARVK